MTIRGIEQRATEQLLGALFNGLVPKFDLADEKPATNGSAPDLAFTFDDTKIGAEFMVYDESYFTPPVSANGRQFTVQQIDRAHEDFRQDLSRPMILELRSN